VCVIMYLRPSVSSLHIYNTRSALIKTEALPFIHYYIYLRQVIALCTAKFKKIILTVLGSYFQIDIGRAFVGVSFSPFIMGLVPRIQKALKEKRQVLIYD
jgi:hypothetical protein